MIVRSAEVLSALKSWLIGTHDFCIDGKQYCFTVDKVRVLAHPLGGFYSWAFNKEGKFKVSQNEANGANLVIDIGFNTLDLYGLKGMKLEPRYTMGDTAGVRRAAEMLQEYIHTEYDVRISRTAANDLLLSDNPIFETAGKGIDLTPVINQVLDAAMTQIADICETRIGNGKQFGRVLLTGGGSALLRKRIVKHFPHALMVPNAVMANAIGCAYAGSIKWRDLNPELVIGLDPGFGGFKVTALRRCKEDQ